MLNSFCNKGRLSKMKGKLWWVFNSEWLWICFEIVERILTLDLWVWRQFHFWFLSASRAGTLLTWGCFVIEWSPETYEMTTNYRYSIYYHYTFLGVPWHRSPSYVGFIVLVVVVTVVVSMLVFLYFRSFLSWLSSGLLLHSRSMIHSYLFICARFVVSLWINPDSCFCVFDIF